MQTKLPYVVQPGSIKKIFEKIKDAKTPDRFTTDFLDTKLGLSRRKLPSIYSAREET
jgi:Family of unknown function (DUF5343)